MSVLSELQEAVADVAVAVGPSVVGIGSRLRGSGVVIVSQRGRGTWPRVPRPTALCESRIPASTSQVAGAMANVVIAKDPAATATCASAATSATSRPG